jgi:hypothetical protein
MDFMMRLRGVGCCGSVEINAVFQQVNHRIPLQAACYMKNLFAFGESESFEINQQIEANYQFNDIY